MSVSNCFSSAQSHKAFLRFVKSISQNLDGTDFERLIKYSLSDNIWSGDILPGLCETIRVVDYQFKANVGTYDVLLYRSHRKEWRTELGRMIPLYQFLISEEQERMKQDLALDRLPANEQTEVLWRSYYYGVWNPVNDPSQWSAYCTGLAKELD